MLRACFLSLTRVVRFMKKKEEEGAQPVVLAGGVSSEPPCDW